jgi:ribosome-binding factor A
MSRDLRVADFVRDEVSRILQRDMRDPRVGSFVIVNDVKVSKDLSYADIYVSSLKSNDAEAQAELVAVLNHAAGFFRTELAKRHTMRTTPKPRFHYDELVERGPRLEQLIGQAVTQDQQRADAKGEEPSQQQGEK